MLYQLYDMQRAALKPMRLWADGIRATFRHPFLPAAYTELGRSIAATAELFERLTRRFGKASFDLETTVVDGQTVAVTEHVVAEWPFWRLLHFVRDTDRSAPRVLLIAPLSGHHATLLRGTVEALLPDHDVYITDWIDASLVPLTAGSFDLDDYIETLIDVMRLLGPNTNK